MQPSWRDIGDGDGPLTDHHRKVTGDLSSLDLSGKNGVVAFIVCLGFWAVAKSSNDWVLAATDVLWALCCIMEGMDHASEL